MNNELIVSTGKKGVRIALMKDKDLIEYHVENQEASYTVGDLYLGVVKKVVPGLNAAFVDVGYEKDAFLHYLDLGPKIRSLNKYTKGLLTGKEIPAKLSNFEFEPEIDKLGKISQVLTKNQKMMVQIAKEPISTKGPRLSCEISLAGRYIVLVPFSNTVSVSRKINDAEERRRLKRLILSIKPEGFGVIIRTVAQNKDVAELNKDLRGLVAKWEQANANIPNTKPKEKILGEVSRVSAMVRDLLNESFDSIVVDDEIVYDEIKRYVQEIAPDKEKIVKLYNSKTKLFESKGIERQLKSLFGKSVSVAGGGYLIIEHTEALHVIDVNSGNKSNIETDQESNALHVNLQAVKEIARQLRLRDMGGIVVCDFIDMRKAENRKLVYDTMKAEMKKDKAKSVILPLSKFGLMQITRQRVRPEMNITTGEVCPHCNGTGKISASIMVADAIENNIDYIFTKQNEQKITLILHPYLSAYFTKGMISLRLKWFFKYKKWIKIQTDSSLSLTTFVIKNSVGEKIELL
ncbi:MAG: Rne/Rng family ribonuclease [Cytophagales bacterium]|nr:Rne/Rng family ribonuclease [Cytophagales bacterium]